MYGPQDWWPGDTQWEVCVGAVLTQNTNWKNVEKAILNLKKARLLGKGEGTGRPDYYPKKLLNTPIEDLANLIKPSGFFNIKTKRLLSVTHWWLQKTKDDIPITKDIDRLRESLLEVKGIGPETADSILLYCFDLPSFVIDAYTKRICSIYLNTPIDINYHELQAIFMNSLSLDHKLFNEFHALLVQLGKQKDWKEIVQQLVS